MGIDCVKNMVFDQNSKKVEVCHVNTWGSRQREGVAVQRPYDAQYFEEQLGAAAGRAN